MDHSQQDSALNIQEPGHQEAWQMVLGTLQAEMSRALYETWVQPLKPIGYNNQVFTVGAFNTYGKAWVEERLGARISRLLEGLYGEAVTLNVTVTNSFYKDGKGIVEISKGLGNDPALDAGKVVKTTAETGPAKTTEGKKKSPPKNIGAEDEIGSEPRNRKMMLQRAYGSERARLIQPERGMFVTGYLFNNWLPLLGHSAFAVILAARSMCYWNPMTGELRNVVETEMGDLAERAAVSVRTVKDVLNNVLVQRYFLRYRVRRVMTSNGVRTAGISLQVRMDDPLTPQDQVSAGLMEEEDWYLAEFSGEKE